jgi:hypothetical protein
MSGTELLMEVYWNPASESWSISSREHGNATWVTHEGRADELDDLLSIARDVMTGG